MRKILIGTPLKGGIEPDYFKGLFDLLHSKVEGCGFGYTFLKGTGVNFARNELADYGRTKKYDELIFWDADLKPKPEHFHRLISHDVDFVAGFYTKRDLATHFHVEPLPGEEPDKNGLLKVRQCAIGFSKIKVSALDRMAELLPERHHILHEGGDAQKPMVEFFPNEIIGPNSNLGRLEAMKEILTATDSSANTDSIILAYHKLQHAMFDTFEQPSVILGEDYGFCRLARQCGLTLHLDTHLMLPHTGGCDFPIPTAKLEAMLQEPWRKEAGVVKPTAHAAFSIIVSGESLWPEDYFRPGLARDHCKDVLAGSYDVPINPETPPTILDIGANIGAFSKWALKRWPGATVFAYEPHPVNFSLLCRTVAGLSCVPKQQAVFTENSEMVLTAGQYNCGEHSLFGAGSGRPSVKVPVIDAADLPSASILKIDTEGAELNILTRLAEVGRIKEFSAIMLEFHADFHRTQIRELLEAHGFVLHEENVHSQHRGEMKFLRKEAAQTHTD